MTKKLIEQMLECIEELRYSNTTHAADTICDSATAAAREYLAQPEQSEQCTESDSWNCKYCRKTETCKALQDPRNFGKPKAPEQDKHTGWYCSHCQCRVDNLDVTFHEQHTVCGRVITDDKAPEPLTDGEIYTAYIEATNQTLRAQDERLALAFARAVLAAQGAKNED